MPGQDSCCFDDWARADLRRGGPDAVTRGLLAALHEAGLRDRTLLDAGCGAGILGVAALESGAAATTGYDLGAGAIGAARTHAAERGVADRARYHVGDAATAALAPHDVVALNRVICCYPDPGALVANTLAASRSVYAVVLPRSDGVVGAIARRAVGWGNRWFARHPRTYGSYRAFVHDVAALDATVRAAGFRPVLTRRLRVVWHLAVYRRA